MTALPTGLARFDLSGKVALITGGGRGLGRTFATALASAGADIAVASRTKSDLEATVALVEQEGRQAQVVVADVTDPADVQAMVHTVLERFGRLDILVNNAGMNIRKNVTDYEVTEWDQVMNLNLRGYFLVARAVAAHMKQRGSGRIINITSILASIGLPNQGAYAGSKGAVTQLTKVLAIELARSGVTVNALAPTYFETELTRPLYEDPERKAFIEERTPMGRWGQPEELEGAIIFLASDSSGFITGHSLVVDGGWLAW